MAFVFLLLWIGCVAIGAAPARARDAAVGRTASPVQALDSPVGLLAADAETDRPATGHAAGEHGEDAHGELGKHLPLWSIIPFTGILLSIALFPLLAPHFWHRNFGKISAFWATLFALPFLLSYRGEALHKILHIYIIDYIPFIILLLALFTISGGILVRGSFKGTPLGNAVLILIGALIASWIGTTGASMVMIRPILRANLERRHKVHIICFFIILVSNIGGSLTPLGDPPLFLGFLHGVPFFWTLGLFPHMILVSISLLVIFLLYDYVMYRREDESVRAAKPSQEPFRLAGAHNLFFLLGVIGFILLSGFWKAGSFSIQGVEVKLQNLVRDLGLLTMGAMAFLTTSPDNRKENEFTWFPIKEVAILFAGIFMTIVPALEILRAGPEGALAGLLAKVQTSVQYFWITGTLSSFLDNAPTYLTFFNSAQARFFPGMAEAEAVLRLIREHPEYLQAISLGAVFMGANTYLGNAPNFMVKSIAEESGIPMPSFLGYVVRFTIPILIPTFLVVGWICF